MPTAVAAHKKGLQDLLTRPIGVVVLGSGAREHALSRQIALSPLCREVFVMPGNDGMWPLLPPKLQAKLRVVPVDLKDLESLAAQIREMDVQLVVVGPDDLLAAGVADMLQDAGIPVFGPSRAAARIESSKAFAKEVMARASIPTAKHFLLNSNDAESLNAAVDGLGGYPVVLKYDGLALGKGVQVCVDAKEAQAFLKTVFVDKRFRSASEADPVVIAEEFLAGHEVSLFALVDGKDYKVLEPACDHKRLLEENKGPNTGGMGAFSPVPWLTSRQIEEIGTKVFPAVIQALREMQPKSPFQGLLYAGLMVHREEFWVLEFNARFGDPETQAILPRMQSDLLPLLYGSARSSLVRHLDAYPLRWSEKACVNIVAASRGYPEKPETGFEIELGMEGWDDDAILFFAGVKANEGRFSTSGGRVLGVSCMGVTVDEARRKALSRIQSIRFEGMQFRKDIGSVATAY